MDKEIIRWLVQHAEDTEWMTAHAAEDQYCPYCHGDKNPWQSCDKHEDDCRYVKMMAVAKEQLKEMDEV